MTCGSCPPGSHLPSGHQQKPMRVKKEVAAGLCDWKSQHPPKASRCLFFFLGCVFSSGSFGVECQQSRLNNEASQRRSRSLAGFPAWWGQMLACFRHPLLHHLQPLLKNIAFRCIRSLKCLKLSNLLTCSNFKKSKPRLPECHQGHSRFPSL